MADNPSSILLTREQSTGSNTNLWGGYLITTQRTTERALRGYQALTVTGDATVSWTNYSATNDYGAMVTKLTGTPSAAFAHTLPGYTTFQALINSAGQTGTFKNSGGTGVSVPASRKSLVYGDGVDIYEVSPNWLNNYASTLTNAGDIVVKATMDAAIAAISTAQNGLVLSSSSATTSKYLDQAVAASGALTITKTNGGTASEALTFSVGSLGLTDGGTVSGAGSVAVNTKYLCDFTSTSYTITLPAAPTAGDIILLTKYGTNAMTLGLNSLKFNGSTTNPVSSLEGSTLLRYSGASRGWVEM